jgi:two-component system sensor histidine kinase DctS
MQPLPPPVSSSRLRWFLALPKLGVVLLLAAVAALLWLLHRNEIEEQRATLIADVLWLEQSVRFHLEGNAEQLQQLALDLTRTGKARELFDLRARHILKNNPDLQQVLWLDGNGKAVDGMPNPALPRSEPGLFGENRIGRSLEIARLGNPVYSDAYYANESVQFEIYVPVFAGGRHRGTLLGVYSLSALLKHQVPWWFAEKYLLRVLDGSGQTLVTVDGQLVGIDPSQAATLVTLDGGQTFMALDVGQTLVTMDCASTAAMVGIDGQEMIGIEAGQPML